MGAVKRRAAQTPAATRAGTGKNRAAAAAQRDIAEAGRRARAARTPIAKIVTRQVADAKRRTYSGEAVSTTRKGSRAARKGGSAR
jgi:hypothetical protein